MSRTSSHIYSTQLPPAAELPFLLITDAQGASRRVVLRTGRVVSGRWSKADVVLDDPQVSRRHAELFRDPFGRWWIRDLGSRNGTQVNGAEAKEQVLDPGDEVRIERFKLVFKGTGGPRPLARRTQA